jgi:hypothetical protein
MSNKLFYIITDFEKEFNLKQTKLNKDINIDIVNKFGQTPLHYFYSKGNLQVVKFLLNNNANPNLMDNNYMTLLHYAAYRGDLAMVKYLVSKGVNPNLMDNQGLTPLHFASNKGKTFIVEYLLDYGVYDTNLYPFLDETIIKKNLKIAKHRLKIGVKKIATKQDITTKERNILKINLEDNSNDITNIYSQEIKKVFINDQQSRVSDLCTYYLNKAVPSLVFKEIISYLKIKDINSLQMAMVKTLLYNHVKVTSDIAEQVNDIFIDSPNLFYHYNPKIMAILVGNAIDNKYSTSETTRYLKKIEFNSKPIDLNIKIENHHILPNNIDMKSVASNIQQGLRSESTIRYFFKIFNIEFPEFYFSKELRGFIDFACGIVSHHSSKFLSYTLLDSLAYYSELEIYKKLNEHPVVSSPTNLMSLGDICGIYIISGGALGLTNSSPVIGMINGAAICMEKHQLFEKELLFETSLRLGLDISIGIYMLYQNVVLMTVISAVSATDIATKVIFSGFDLLINSLISPMISMETTPFSADLRADLTYQDEVMQYEINSIGDHTQPLF